jgi:hypothetical protein
MGDHLGLLDAPGLLLAQFALLLLLAVRQPLFLCHRFSLPVAAGMVANN